MFGHICVWHTRINSAISSAEQHVTNPLPYGGIMIERRRNTRELIDCILIFLGMSLLFLLISTAAYPGQDHDNSLVKPFSDLSIELEMSDEWKNQEIQHEDWAKVLFLQYKYQL